MMIVYFLLSIPRIFQYLFLLGVLCVIPYVVLASLYSLFVRKIHVKESVKLIGLVGCATLANMSIFHVILLLFQNFD